MADSKVKMSRTQTTADFLQEFHAQNPGDFPLVPSSIGPSSYELLASLSAQIGHNRPIRVLDLGCGSGLLGNMVAEKIHPGGQVVGLDRVFAQTRRAHAAGSSSNVTYLCGQADRLAFGDAGFDLVLSHMALDFMQPLPAVLAEVDRVLKNDGYFSFVIAHADNDSGIEKDYQGIIRRILKKEQKLDFAMSFTDRRLYDSSAFDRLIAAHTSFKKPYMKRPFSLLLKMSARNYLQFISGDYAWAMISNEGRHQARKDISSILNGEGELVPVNLAMQLVTLQKKDAP